jgi:hypothetical protein
VGGKSGGETGENPSKGDNQQQTQLTYDGRWVRESNPVHSSESRAI